MLIDFIAIFLIEWLGHDNLKQREVAHYITLQYNNYFDCRQMIYHAAYHHPDSEVRKRCKIIGRRYILLEPTRGYYPRLDHMHHEDGDEISKRIEDARPQDKYYYMEPDNYETDQKYRKLSMQYALFLLNSGLTRYQVRDIMDRAVNEERKQNRFPIEEE